MIYEKHTMDYELNLQALREMEDLVPMIRSERRRPVQMGPLRPRCGRESMELLRHGRNTDELSARFPY